MAIYRQRYVESDRTNAAMKDSILSSWSKLMTHEIQRVRNVSELGVIAQLHQSTLTDAIREDLGITDPVSTTYKGEKAVRAMPEISQIYENEDFEQKVVFLGNRTITNPTMYYRKIGSTGCFQTVALATVGNNVMRAQLPNPGYDFEYYIQGAVGGETVTYPVTGGNGTGNINKTVITVKKVDFVTKEWKPLPAITP